MQKPIPGMGWFGNIVVIAGALIIAVLVMIQSCKAAPAKYQLVTDIITEETSETQEIKDDTSAEVTAVEDEKLFMEEDVKKDEPQEQEASTSQDDLEKENESKQMENLIAVIAIGAALWWHFMCRDARSERERRMLK